MTFIACMQGGGAVALHDDFDADFSNPAHSFTADILRLLKIAGKEVRSAMAF